jgi:acetoacetyl-CoA reductase
MSQQGHEFQQLSKDRTHTMEDKRVALVTGGMGGLGTAICRKLDQAGFRVAATYSPGNASPHGWLAASEWMVQKLLAEMGRFDVLVNNAGITRDASLRKMSTDDWHAVLRANLDSVFNLSKQALEPMSAQKWGRIINISSVNGQKGAFGQANYAAAKAGMHGFTKALALETARLGITVNTVSPGYLDTKMVRQVPQEVMDSKILPQIPVGRLGQPSEVAALVAYLCSEEAGFVTGANVAINGGQHMG